MRAEGRRRQKKTEKELKKNASYLSFLTSSSSSSWTCISAARSALPTPCWCPGRMSCPHFSQTAPRRDVSSRGVSPLSGGGFIAVGRAGSSALPSPAARGRASAPTCRAPPGRCPGQGKRWLCWRCAHFLHLCELLGIGRFQASGAGVEGRGGADLLLQSLSRPNSSRRPALTSAPPALTPKLRSPWAAGCARLPAESEREWPRRE